MLQATSNPTLSTQIGPAILLAVAACVSPTALAVLIYYLGRPSAKRLALGFLGGAFVMTFAVGLTGILVLGGIDLNPGHHRSPSAGLDIALGGAMLAAALVLLLRKAKKRGGDPPAKERRGSTVSAVLLGLAMYTPSLLYLAALKQVADADPSTAGAVFSALILTLCVLLFVEIPVGLFLLFPEATNTRLKAFDAWIHRHLATVGIWAFTIGGLYMLGYGIDRLVGS
jgi:hypothetical protein